MLWDLALSVGGAGGVCRVGLWGRIQEAEVVNFSLNQPWIGPDTPEAIVRLGSTDKKALIEKLLYLVGWHLVLYERSIIHSYRTSSPD
jgi:hypothetical protein